MLELLGSYGLDPELAFADNPARDRNLLEDIFPSLSEGIELDNIGMHSDSVEQPILELCRGSYQYLDDAENARAALCLLQDQLDLVGDAEEKGISLDVEWLVFNNTRGKISILQLASPVYSNELVIHIGRMESPRLALLEIQAILGQTNIAIVGCML